MKWSHCLLHRVLQGLGLARSGGSGSCMLQQYKLGFKEWEQEEQLQGPQQISVKINRVKDIAHQVGLRTWEASQPRIAD